MIQCPTVVLLGKGLKGLLQRPVHVVYMHCRSYCCPNKAHRL